MSVNLSEKNVMHKPVANINNFMLNSCCHKYETPCTLNCLENSQPVGLQSQLWEYEPVSIEEVTVLRERLSSGKSKGCDGKPAQVSKYESSALL